MRDKTLTLVSASEQEPFGDTYANAFFHDTFRLAGKPLPPEYERPWQFVVDPDGMPLGMSTCGRIGNRVTSTIAVNKWAAKGARGRTVERMLREGLPLGAVAGPATTLRHNPDTHQVKVEKLLRRNPIVQGAQPDLFEASDTTVSIPWQHATPEQLLAAAADNSLPWSDLAEIDDYILGRSFDVQAGGDLQEIAAWHGVAAGLAMVLDESFLEELHALKASVALMDVDDDTTAEEVQRELDAGNPYMLQNIREALRALARRWEASRYAEGESELPNLEDMMLGSDVVVDGVLAEVNNVSLDLYKDAVRSQLFVEVKRKYHSPFQVSTEPSGSVVYSGRLSSSYWFPPDLVPLWADAVPIALVHWFWDQAGSAVEWQERDRLTENWGDGDGESFYVSYEGDLDEWATDVISSVYDEIADKDPLKAAENVLSMLPVRLRDQVHAANLSTKEVVDLGRLLFDGNHSAEGDREEALDEIAAYLDDLTAKAPDDRRVLAVVDRAQLRQWGITSGVLWEEAPWSLIVLAPSELRYEGMQMRHCVGDKDMGYIRAVREGDIEIWSLRSANGKPRFTLEVEPRGNLAPRVRQIKGKANRRFGYASASADRIVFPEEVTFWWHLLQQLGIPHEDAADCLAFFNPDSDHLWGEAPTVEEAPRQNPHRRPVRDFNTPWRP